MLVALPSAIAFGLIVYAPLGSAYSGTAAVAGVVGAIALGCVAPVFGGTPRLVTAPCAPGAAVLSVFVAELVQGGSISPALIPVYMALVALAAGVLQFAAGNLGGGKVIKYIPYPVVAGYLNGVALLILLGQIPKLLGLPKGIALYEGVISPALWQWPSLAVGMAAVAGMLLAPKIAKSIPASIIALGTGCACYGALALLRPELATLDGNRFVVGPIAKGGLDYIRSLSGQWSAVQSIGIKDIDFLVVPTLTLAVLLSVDTLKTCVILDALTYSRHNSNKELAGQGLANIVSALAFGIPGAGTIGPSLVNLSSGAKTRLSGFFAGISALAVFLLFGKYIAWIPLASLAGILVVVALKAIDWTSLHLLRHRSTVFDFCVILAVVVSAVSMSLIEAAGVGIAMAIILYLRQQIYSSVVRRKALGNQVFSKKKRLDSDRRILESEGGKTIVFELQGQLFFGTADQLLTETEPYVSRCRYVVLDMRRVQSVDFTAAHMLAQIHARIRVNSGRLILASVPLSRPTGQNVKKYLGRLGLDESREDLMYFPVLDEALEWIEDEILKAARGTADKTGAPLDLSAIEFFAGFRAEVLDNLRACLIEKNFERGETIFERGDKSDAIFFLRKGTARIVLHLPGGMTHHLATFVAGDLFGEMSFLDNGERSANATATEDSALYILPREAFDELASKHPATAGKFYERLACIISRRLRQTDAELMAIEGS
jgi:SulP family sulfate permease